VGPLSVLVRPRASQKRPRAPDYQRVAVSAATAIASEDGAQASHLPVRVPRDVAAKLVTLNFFEISPRTLERWPLSWCLLNGRAHCETEELFAEAASRLAAAAAVMGGSRTPRVIAALGMAGGGPGTSVIKRRTAHRNRN
jgi:hypothetical protein